ncbi:glycosyltransferase [Agreia sp. Leaf283]|uniref:glycosyltransferase n=1 Tax=Agreia sp. Leaf283 TaxID=1736321 RepID=UPI00138F16FB|nr:glycosyltransferase [Agreia sp. Leaf283]
MTVHQITTLPTHFPTYARYLAWILGAAKLARRLRKEKSFDVFHHATYASDWFVNPFALMGKGRHETWVWGPAGGASYAPTAVSRAVMGSTTRVETARRVATGVVRTMVHALTRRKVDVALALNADSASSFLASGFKNVIVKTNAVIDYEGLPPRSPSDGPVIVFAGRGVRWKGLSLVIASIAFLPDTWRIVIAGPETDSDYYRGLASAFSDRVDFLGVLDRNDTLELFARATALALPSLHDSAPWAAAEASGIGIPVVCLDLGGVASMAGELAMPVSTENPRTLPKRYAAALIAAANVDLDPDRSHTEGALEACIARSYGESVA